MRRSTSLSLTGAGAIVAFARWVLWPAPAPSELASTWRPAPPSKRVEDPVVFNPILVRAPDGGPPPTVSIVGRQQDGGPVSIDLREYHPTGEGNAILEDIAAEPHDADVTFGASDKVQLKTIGSKVNTHGHAFHLKVDSPEAGARLDQTPIDTRKDPELSGAGGHL